MQSMYSNYKTTVAAPSVMQTQVVPFSVQAGTCGTGSYSNMVAIYIDYNQNGSFADAGEQVYISPTYTTGAHTESGNITIPLTALAGNTVMRVMNIETTVASTFTPCASYGYGETEDYLINIVQVQPCSGAPTAGTATASVSNICAGSNFTLSLTGYTLATGINIQWQSSANGVTYTDIAGATSVTYTGSQVATSYYRAAVSCNTGTPVYSNAVQITSPGLFPAGTYAIDSSQPTDPTSTFQSFTAAVNAISCGIAGEVTFEVMPGTYVEQITIPQIFGASATSRVIFHGNGETISFASSNTNARHVIKLDGADYITIDSLNIVASAGTYGWGIHLTNEANYNRILRNTINVGNSTTSTNYSALVASGSPSGATTSGNSANYTLIQDNTIIGGYYAFTLMGEGTGNPAVGNQVIGNNIRDAYYYHTYFYYQDGLVVRGNDISRPNHTSPQTFYGLYMVYNSNAEVDGNIIHDAFGTNLTSTGSAYGIYLSSSNVASSQQNRFINNKIYNIKNNGTIYGMYNSASGGTVYYHNTVSLDHTAATAGTVYGFYQSGAPIDPVEFKNNIISITRGGTGTKYSIYLSSSAITPALFQS
ncbi:MAG: hypothetical protein EOP51_27375, partial [Sphingobacteriales bacterium]